MHEFGFEASFTSQNNWKIRLFPKPVGKIAITSWLEIRASNASLCSEFSGNVANIPAVLQPSSTCQWFQLLTAAVNVSRINQSYFCVVKPTDISLALAVRAVSLFLSWAAAPISGILRFCCSTHNAPSCEWLTDEKRETAHSLLHLVKERHCQSNRCVAQEHIAMITARLNPVFSNVTIIPYLWYVPTYASNASPF